MSPPAGCAASLPGSLRSFPCGGIYDTKAGDRVLVSEFWLTGPVNLD